MWETQVQCMGWEDPLEKEMEMHSSILPGEFREQRSLTDYSLRGHKELDTTEWISVYLSVKIHFCFVITKF